MRKELVLELSDVYGGDSEVRIEKQKEIKMQRTKKKTEKRADIGLSVSDNETEEQSVEVIDKQIYTFRKDADGCPILRLGGSHGKIYGALKESALTLRMLGVSPFKSGYKQILNSIMISPVWVRLESENGSQMQVQQLPQILAGFKKTMIIQKYDVIPKCKVKIELAYPDVMDEAVQKMLKGLETMSLFNKRRATCKIVG